MHNNSNMLKQLLSFLSGQKTNFYHQTTEVFWAVPKHLSSSFQSEAKVHDEEKPGGLTEEEEGEEEDE